MINDILRAAQINYYGGNLHEAKKLYKKALKIDPHGPTARIGLLKIEDKILNKNSGESVGTGEMIRRMIKNRRKLTYNQISWVTKIKHTSDNFHRINFTPRQRAVIEDIYTQFTSC